MRILLWHGYLLGGTGSNVYTRMLAREWGRAGHDVTVFCQEPDPEAYDLGGVPVVRPDVGGLLPTFVLDRYEGYRVARVQDCTQAELDAWVEANASVLRAHLPADVVFCNHVLLGGPVGAATGARSPSRRTARSSILDARQRAARPLGTGEPAPGGGDLRRLGPHSRGAGGGLRFRRARLRGATRGRHRRLGAGTTTGGSRGAARDGARRPAERRRRERAAPR